MKKLLGILLALTLIMGMFGATALAEDKPLFGIMAPQATHGWLAAVTYNAKVQADELGLNYKQYTYASAAEAAGYIEELIQQGAKAIVAFPQAEGLETATQMALDAGITFVNFDVKIAVDGTYFLCGDNYGMGVESAKYIADKLGGKGKVAILTITTSSNVTVDRIAGFSDTIKEIAPDIEVVGEYAGNTWARTDSVVAVADMLTANPELDAIFSLDDEASIGAIQAINEAGRTDIKVLTGGGGCQEYFELFKDSPINLCSALYSPAMIRDCITEAVGILIGDTYDKEIVIPTAIVDKANVDQYLNPDSPY